LKTKAARRDIPLPKQLEECLKEAKKNSTSEYVVANSEGQPLSYTHAVQGDAINGNMKSYRRLPLKMVTTIISRQGFGLVTK